MSGVVVIGAGLAGVAAAWGARRAGSRVTVVSSGAGASALGSGAVDDVHWEDLVRASRVLRTSNAPAPPLASAVSDFAAELDLWALTAARPWLATVAGRARPARGHDRALLNLALLGPGIVLVPRADRAGWDADAIARALDRSELARGAELSFQAVDASVLRFDDERRASDAELASRHDHPERIGWLAERLRDRLGTAGRAAAVLLGPWLGARASRAAELSAAVGAPCGEALIGAGSPAGLRFEAARDRLLDATQVSRLTGRVIHVRRADGGGLSLTVRGREGEPVAADAVVLALGGLVAGGIVYTPPDRQTGAARAPFELSLDAPVGLSTGTARLHVIGSTHGPELDHRAWPTAGAAAALEQVGVACEDGLAAPSIWAAGDVVAGRPRTALAAVAAGLAAGLAAAGTAAASRR